MGRGEDEEEKTKRRNCRRRMRKRRNCRRRNERGGNWERKYRQRLTVLLLVETIDPPPRPMLRTSGI